MSAWQPITTAPRDGTRILGFVPHWPEEERIGVMFLRDGEAWQAWFLIHDEDGEYYYDVEPSHWQPIPGPPDTERTAL